MMPACWTRRSGYSSRAPTAPTPSSRDQPTIWLSHRGLITSVSSLRNSSRSSSTMAAAVLLMAAKLNLPVAVGDPQHPVRQRGEIVERGRIVALVVDDVDPVIAIGRLRQRIDGHLEARRRGSRLGMRIATEGPSSGITGSKMAQPALAAHSICSTRQARPRRWKASSTAGGRPRSWPACSARAAPSSRARSASGRGPGARGRSSGRSDGAEPEIVVLRALERRPASRPPR